MQNQQDRLRLISVTVEEPLPGAFHWLLLEGGEHPTGWAEIESSEKAFKSYRKAMTAGLLALQGMIDDLDAGPREAPRVEMVRKKPVGPFGFGQLR